MSIISYDDVPKSYLRDDDDFMLGQVQEGTMDLSLNTKRFYITQEFGENLNDFYKNWRMKGHNGIDYSVRSGYNDGNYQTRIFAGHDGWVISDASTQSYTKGIYVTIMSDEVTINSRPCKVKTVYFHLSKAFVSVKPNTEDQWWKGWFKKNKNYVKGGALIGLAGNSGEYTTGPHLHFGMHIYWKQTDGTYQLDWDNGYYGAVDPQPYFYDFNVHESNGRTFHFNGKQLPSWATAERYIKKYNY